MRPAAWRSAAATSRPRCCCRGAWPTATSRKVTQVDRRKLGARLLEDRGDLMVVTGIGSSTYDVAACGDHALNFYIWSGLGCTPMVGLGLALAQPSRRVAVITGDGDVLMALGSLATIGIKQPKN